MEQPKTNPICKRGERNIYCPFYSDCLDQAISKFWNYWSCSKCSYREIRSLDEVVHIVDIEVLEYDFSPDIIRQGRGNESR